MRGARGGKPAPAPAPADAAAAIVHALQLGLRGRLDARSHAALAWFATSRGEPTVDVDERVVAAFARNSRTALPKLMRHRNALLRHATAWAATTTGDGSAVPLLLALLLDQRGHFDHDFAYVGAHRLGTLAVPILERLAARRRGLARTFAISCIGHTRGGAAAVAALRRIVGKHGFAPGALDALANLHEPSGVGLAIAGLRDERPQQASDALFALSSSLDRLPRNRTIPHRRTAARRIGALYADERTWTEPHDPWSSIFELGLELLARLDRPTLRVVLRQADNRKLDDSRREAVAEFGAKLRR